MIIILEAPGTTIFRQDNGAASSSQIWQPPIRLHSYPCHRLNNMFFTNQIHLAIICNKTSHCMFICCSFYQFQKHTTISLVVLMSGANLWELVVQANQMYIWVLVMGDTKHRFPCSRLVGKWACVKVELHSFLTLHGIHCQLLDISPTTTTNTFWYDASNPYASFDALEKRNNSYFC